MVFQKFKRIGKKQVLELLKDKNVYLSEWCLNNSVHVYKKTYRPHDDTLGYITFDCLSSIKHLLDEKNLTQHLTEYTLKEENV